VGFSLQNFESMFSLSSYNSERHDVLRTAIVRKFAPGDLVAEGPMKGQSYLPEEGFFRVRRVTAEMVLSNGQPLAQFTWADWPKEQAEAGANEVGQFHLAHPRLRPVPEGSELWNAVFRGYDSDPESAREIYSIFKKHPHCRPRWVRSQRDCRGTIKALVDSEMGQIELDLAWKYCNVRGVGALWMQAEVAQAVDEVKLWASSRIQPILDALKTKLQALYRDRFRDLYVFGSYARPDAGIKLPIDSDLDVAVLLKDFEDPHAERERVSDFIAELSLNNDIVISLMPVREADYREGRTNFTRVISEYAVPVK
jgi:uncharacterized protein